MHGGKYNTPQSAAFIMRCVKHDNRFALNLGSYFKLTKPTLDTFLCHGK